MTNIQMFAEWIYVLSKLPMQADSSSLVKKVKKSLWCATFWKNASVRPWLFAWIWHSTNYTRSFASKGSISSPSKQLRPLQFSIGNERCRLNWFWQLATRRSLCWTDIGARSWNIYCRLLRRISWKNCPGVDLQVFFFCDGATKTNTQILIFFWYRVFLRRFVESCRGFSWDNFVWCFNL